MKSKSDDLRAKLFSSKDGTVICDAINALTKLAKKGDEDAKKVLADYVSEGAIDHMRQYACSSLAESIENSDGQFANIFRQGLTDSHTRYWSILGYIKSAGKDAYKDLAKIAGGKTIPLDERCQAIKCLAIFSKQQFDRNLPSDPGYWKESDLRLSEVKAWAKDGYPDGKDYSTPKRHAALDKPKTAFEKIVSQFDAKLARKRNERQDWAAPSNWLSVAEPNDIRQIKARWELPSIYLDFLTRYSPIQVTIETRKFYNHFQLFGAGELLDAQDGYSFDPIKKKPMKDWPEHLVVIANHGGDPLVLDLSKSDGKEAPVEMAEHGIGVWDFDRVANSFAAFLKTLAK